MTPPRAITKGAEAPAYSATRPLKKKMFTNLNQMLGHHWTIPVGAIETMDIANAWANVNEFFFKSFRSISGVDSESFILLML